MNMKSIVDKLQSEKAFFKTQIDKLEIEMKKLVILNKSLKNKVVILEKDSQKKILF